MTFKTKIIKINFCDTAWIGYYWKSVIFFLLFIHLTIFFQFRIRWLVMRSFKEKSKSLTILAKLLLLHQKQNWCIKIALTKAVSQTLGLKKKRWRDFIFFRDWILYSLFFNRNDLLNQTITLTLTLYNKKIHYSLFITLFLVKKSDKNWSSKPTALRLKKLDLYSLFFLTKMTCLTKQSLSFLLFIIRRFIIQKSFHKLVKKATVYDWEKNVRCFDVKKKRQLEKKRALYTTKFMKKRMIYYLTFWWSSFAAKKKPG